MDTKESKTIAQLLRHYGCGPIRFAGTDNAFYERHLVFDNVIEVTTAGARERFEAVARLVRDVLAQRWVQTEQTYARDNPKRVYYLSMEFLIGRSLANNVTNLLLDPLVQQAVQQKNLDWFALLEEEPDAGLGNGGLGRLAACFLDSMATMQLPAMGYGLRYEYGIFRQSIQDGWQHEEADNWLRRPDPWEVARPHERVAVQLNCSFEVRGGTFGTRDGATIEMAEEAGEEHLFLFGLTAQQVADSRGWYSPYWHYDNEPETRAALDLIFSDHFSRYEPGVFAPLRDALLTHEDHYRHLADLTSYLEADQRLVERYAHPDAWARQAIVNIAGSGKFSSDRTIAEYAADIWQVAPCPVV